MGILLFNHLVPVPAPVPPTPIRTFGPELMPQQTLQYKTFLKRAIGGAISDVFKGHPDPLLRKTKVTIEFPRDKASYPAVVIRFFERMISNAGIGHYEYLFYPGEGHFRAKHYLYSGDLEFGVYALSSFDRDLVSDTLIQMIAMGDLEAYTSNLLREIYPKPLNGSDYALYHYINLRTDNIQGFGETQTKVPWGTDDDLLYQSAYRMACSGELYNRPLDHPTPLVSKVNEYPYIKGVEPEPNPDPNNPNPWTPDLPLSDDGLSPPGNNNDVPDLPVL